MIELTSILMSPVDSWQLSQYLKQLSSVWLLLDAVITSTLAADKHLVLIWTHQSTDLVQKWSYKLYFHMLRACTKFECELKTNHRWLSSKIQDWYIEALLQESMKTLNCCLLVQQGRGISLVDLHYNCHFLSRCKDGSATLMVNI